MTVLKLKVDSDPVSGATCKVNVAETTAPGANVSPSLFHVKVKMVLADSGIQEVVVIFSVSVLLLVFFR